MALERILKSAKKIAGKSLGALALGALAFLPMNKTLADTHGDYVNPGNTALAEFADDCPACKAKLHSMPVAKEMASAPIVTMADDFANTPIHYVATNGACISPYTNWANASTNIQMAVDVAGDGDEVLIADGQHYVAPTNGISWSGKHLVVKSQNGPANCILNGKTKGRLFTLNGGQTTNDIIDGLSITNGKTQTAYVSGSTDTSGGAGILCDGTSPTIKNCIFAYDIAYKSAWGNLADGGAVDCVNGSTAVIISNLIRNCESTHTGAGIHSYGAFPKIWSNTIVSNTTDGCYGGIIGEAYISGGEIINNFIAYNVIKYYTNGGYGTISLLNSGPKIEGNTVVSNSTFNGIYPGRGGGLRVAGSPYPAVTNNIFAGNRSLSGYEDLDFPYTTDTFNFSYNLMEKGTTNFVCPNRNSNIWGLNPRFADITNGNYRLAEDSPCIDKGTNLANVVTDLNGNSRFIDGDYDGTNRSDMGCYEFVPPQVLVVTDSGTNGIITPGTIYMPKGTITNFNVRANGGYHLTSLVTNFVPVYTNSGNERIANTNLSWKVMEPSNNIVAVFDLNRYAVNVNGQVTNVNHGESLEQTVDSPVDVSTGVRKVANGARVIGNDYTLVSSNGVYIPAVTNDVIFDWLWKTQANVNVASTGNGTVNGWTNDYSDLGSIINLNANPNDHSHFVRWTGVPSGSESNSNLNLPVNGPKNLEAVFDIDKYSINSSVGSNGRITPSQMTVDYNGNTDALVEADQYYVIDQFFKNDQLVPEASGKDSYNVLFDAVTNNQNFAATFKQKTTSGGTPYVWLDGIYHLGTNANVELEDSDGDGLKNWQEYIAGTDPTNSGSCVKPLEITKEGNNSKLILTETATNRDYVVYGRTNLYGGDWVTKTNHAGTGSNLVFDLTEGDDKVWFYKSAVRMPQ